MGDWEAAMRYEMTSETMTVWLEAAGHYIST